MKIKVILLFVAALVVLAFAYNFAAKNQEIGQKNEEKTQKTLKIGEITFNIGIADTNIKRERGLSGRDGLGENEGLLFIFEKEGYYGFWMKDMKFSIDIIWINKNKQITHTEENISAETYPKVFNSPNLSLYVLEIPAGFLSKNNVKIGDFIAF